MDNKDKYNNYRQRVTGLLIFYLEPVAQGLEPEVK